MKKPTVFISYSHADRHFVDKLTKSLEATGVDVWFDKWKIKVGDSITQKINEGIGASDFLIVILSRTSVKSKWVREELDAATIRNVEEDKHAFILPVLIEDCKMPTLLQHRKYANFKDDPEQAFQELLEVIQPAVEQLEEMPGQPAAFSWSKAVKVLGPLLLVVILAILAVWTFVVKPWRTATPTNALTPTATTTNTPELFATPTSPALTEISFIEPIRKQICRELRDIQDSGVGDEEAYAEIARRWGITVDDVKAIAAECIEMTPIPPTPMPTQPPQPTPEPPTPVEAAPTPTPRTDCTEGPKSPECYEVDIYTKDGTVLTNVELKCGPKSIGMVGVTSNATIRFTDKLEDIRAEIFPERCLNFSCISRIDFLEMNEDESSAVASYIENRSDYFYGRQWRKVKITLYDGGIWDNVYVYDKCSFKSTYEVGPLDALDPTTIVIRPKENCK